MINLNIMQNEHLKWGVYFETSDGWELEKDFDTYEDADKFIKDGNMEVY